MKSGNPYRFEGRIRVSSEDEVTNLIKIKEKEVKELKAKMFIRKLNEEKRNREAFKEKQKLKIEQNMISVLKEIAKVNEKNSSLHLKNHKRIGDISTIRDKSLSKPLELPVIKNSSEITDVKDRGSFRGYYLNEESHSNVPWKNSPYYFNDPKLNKLLDDRGKYNHNKYAKLYMKYSTEKL